MRRPLNRVVLLFVVASATTIVSSRPALAAFSDVPSNYWDAAAIKYVASDRPWMRDYGTSMFQPHTLETRSFLARTLVTAFAPNIAPDRSITFSDLPSTDPFYRYANVAVKLGWMMKYANGRWNGAGAVPANAMDQALIGALGLARPVAGLGKPRDGAGHVYTTPGRFAQMELARWLDLRADHSDPTQVLQANTPVPRDEVAYSLYRAATLPSWKLSGAGIFNTVTFGTPANTVQQQVIQYALNQVGYPYIYGGEWNAKSPPGYCCGAQPQGGFDCSGFVWWLLKKPEGGYNAAQFRSYAGWSLPERTSYDMARVTTKQLSYAQLSIGDVLMFSPNGSTNWQDVNHVGVYLGNGWIAHSTGGGVQIDSMVSGWYHTTFAFGRALTVQQTTSLRAAVGQAPVTAGDPLDR